MLRVQQLPLVVVFAQVCREGSITRAAYALGLSKSVVSTHLRTLEAMLGARLLDRTTRRLALTQTGEAVLAAAGRVVAATDEIRLIAEAQREAPTGTLRVAASQDLGTRFVAPAVARLLATHPDLRAELLLDDATQDLI